MLVDAKYLQYSQKSCPVALYSEYSRALTFENFKVSRSLLTEGNGGGEGGGKDGGGQGEGGGGGEGGGTRYCYCEHRNAVSVLKQRWTHHQLHHELRHQRSTHPHVSERLREAQRVEEKEGEGEGDEVGLRALVCGVGCDLSLIEHQSVDIFAALAAGGTVLFPALGLDLPAHNTSASNLEHLLRLSSAGACPFFKKKSF